MTDLPVIDLTGLEAGSAATLDRVAYEVETATALSGFFYVSNHGIAEESIAALMAAACGFFAAPPAVKAAIAINQVNRGYLAEGQARMRGAAHTDLKEVFFWGRELADDDPDLVAGRALCGPNQWPSAPPGFRADVERYFHAVRSVGTALLRAFAVSLGSGPDFFAPHYARPMARGQLIHYPAPPADAADDLFGVAPHSDFGCITLLYQEMPGLEVLTRRGDWIAAPPIAGTLVINIGDLLERWTNGRLPSTTHRVRNTSGGDRYSAAVFYDPSPSAVVDPRALPGAGETRFPPIAAADYILQRNQSVFAHYDPTIGEARPDP